MKRVSTVIEEIGEEQLGVVTTHEHVLLDLTAFYQALPVAGIDDPATQKVEMWNLGILSRDCYALKDNLLLDDERDVYRRAYNSSHLSKPKRASHADYRCATGFEAVIGMLYWLGDDERLNLLLETGHKEIENDTEN